MKKLVALLAATLSGALTLTAALIAMPFVSRAAAVGDTITWTNAGDLTADDVVNANQRGPCPLGLSCA